MEAPVLYSPSGGTHIRLLFICLGPVPLGSQHYLIWINHSCCLVNLMRLCSNHALANIWGFRSTIINRTFTFKSLFISFYYIYLWFLPSEYTPFMDIYLSFIYFSWFLLSTSHFFDLFMMIPFLGWTLFCILFSLDSCTSAHWYFLLLSSHIKILCYATSDDCCVQHSN